MSDLDQYLANLPAPGAVIIGTAPKGDSGTPLAILEQVAGWLEGAIAQGGPEAGFAVPINQYAGFVPGDFDTDAKRLDRVSNDLRRRYCEAKGGNGRFVWVIGTDAKDGTYTFRHTLASRGSNHAAGYDHDAAVARWTAAHPMTGPTVAQAQAVQAQSLGLAQPQNQ